jgi:phosphoglycerol transferase MdoB-like AlkP superfamily enzyme
MKLLQTVLTPHIRLILKVYLIGIIIFFLFRLILFLTELGQLETLPANSLGLILQSFFLGLRFDTTVSGYFIALPFLLLSIMCSFKIESNLLSKSIAILLIFFYTIGFLICAIDIPYFNHFFSRFSTAGFAWQDSPDFVINMIIQEPRYWLAIVPFLIFSVSFAWLINRFFGQFVNQLKQGRQHKRVYIIISSMLMLVFIFVGIRGRVAEKSPIRVGTAYFSNYAFLNMLGLNPVFTFMRSTMDDLKPGGRKLILMEENRAISNVQKYLNINSPNYESPIARKENVGGLQHQLNIVLIIMENMSAEKMARYGNRKNLTPFLDSLAMQGLCFDNIYTSGIHTFNGVYSTLFSYPSLFKKHPMKSVSMQSYNGISSTLKDFGYYSIYFTTHDDQFDNIGGFLRANEFDEIIAQDNYPSEKVLSTLGVPDHYLFEFSLPKLNQLNYTGNPFLAAYMTASDHGPYIIPENIPFTPKSIDMKQQIVEYADWSISNFFKLASKEAWFDSTLFVLVADHGTSLASPYDMPLSFHHTPLIFYAPGILDLTGCSQKIGGQIDVFPTIMGICQLPYINNTLGINLLNEERPFIYFTADDKLGVLNQEYFLIVRNAGGESLYKYRESSVENEIDIKNKLVESMKTYTYSMLQTANWLIENKKTNIQETDSSKFTGRN